ncbi:unnamed protein product (macronuclear) [Paramecium tetraurelia]|uniref:protein-tyrosine-phosphatase n=1 Tax=Paramecium tetraurelia TaxID=5888 RepID=A0BQL4_PARTE|nr:uncharacterized protein GSPATT00031060001 [Paramecium tetraurelia]CAK60831.1 unnamed protein product [Paramecium tetraurelia]|eukprot:XP_001428229.1 hypothetical protein (macronuclear) [Paramecium tetraurelia strain d4-2]
MLFRGINNYKSMNTILDQTESQGALWLGDYTAAINQQLLKQKNIKTVLTVASGLNVKYPPTSDIVHKVYNILDIESCNIKRIWGDTYQQIDEGLLKGSVLVHCAAGVSRSAATVIAYLMRKQGMSFQEAFQFARLKRSVVCPNFGFQRQLKQFERELLNGNGKVETEIAQQQQQISQSAVKPMIQQQQLTIQPHQIPISEKKTTIRRNQLTPASKLPKPVFSNNVKQVQSFKK